MAEERICRVLTESERAGVSLALERPLTVPDLIRLQRIVSHLAESRETLCPEVRGPEVLPEPQKTSFCSLLKRTIDSAIDEAVRKGRIEDPDRFTALIYWSDRLRKTYSCPR